MSRTQTREYPESSARPRSPGAQRVRGVETRSAGWRWLCLDDDAIGDLGEHLRNDATDSFDPCDVTTC